MQNKHSIIRQLKWGLSTLGCPDLSLPQVMEIAARYGLDFLEIRALNNSINTFETLYYPENEPVMRKISAENRCPVLDSSFHLVANRMEERDTLLKIARTADEYNIPYIRIFGGGKAGNMLTDAELQYAADALAWFRAQKFHVRLALETHDICCNYRNCLRIQKISPEPMPVIWDIHHTFHVSGDPLEETFAALKNDIVAVHFKDSRRTVNGNGETEMLFDIPGRGNLPLMELFSLLAEHDFTGPVILEHEKFWRPYLPEITVALDAWQNLISVAPDK